MSKIGIVAAMPVEIENFAKELGAAELKMKGLYKIYSAEKGGNSIFLACSGIGKVNSAACTQKLIDSFDVEYVINMGIAGGISAELKTLDVVIGKDVRYHDFSPSSLLQRYYPFTESFACDEKLVGVAEKVCRENLNGNRYYVGTIASGDCFVESGEVKRHIREDVKGVCCEMEGASIGHVCYLNSVPFLILRSISDLADEGAEMSYSEFEKKAALQANKIVFGIIDQLK